MGNIQKNISEQISISISNKVFRKFNTKTDSELVYRNSYELNKMIHEIFVDEVYKPIKKLQINSVLDLGSNIGISALYFLKQFRECKVCSYEPNPISFALQHST